MNKFTCSTCGEVHPLVTLLEFPQPDIISEISSGKKKGELNVLSKNIYRVDWEKLILKVELNLNIIDYEDELDILIWAEVESKHVREKMSELLADETTEVVLEGILIQEIPFYRNTINSPITLIISNNKMDLHIQTVFKNEHLKTDLEKGIAVKDLTNILEKLYHYDKTDFDADTK